AGVGRQIDDRADGTQGVRERHVGAAMAHTAGRAQVRTHAHGGDNPVLAGFRDGDAHQARKQRGEELLEVFGARHRNLLFAVALGPQAAPGTHSKMASFWPARRAAGAPTAARAYPMPPTAPP